MWEFWINKEINKAPPSSSLGVKVFYIGNVLLVHLLIRFRFSLYLTEMMYSVEAHMLDIFYFIFLFLFM